MPKRRAGGRSESGAGNGSSFAGKLTPDADLTWLLHRAAQRMRAAVDEQAERHGIQLRDYIVLSGLALEKPMTQLELGQALGLDKTTLTFELDRLEKKGLIVRRAAPRDRRSRIPEATAAGRSLQAKVAAAVAGVEASLLSAFASGEQRSLRTMLCELIGEESVKGSCV